MTEQLSLTKGEAVMHEDRWGRMLPCGVRQVLSPTMDDVCSLCSGSGKKKKHLPWGSGGRGRLGEIFVSVVINDLIAQSQSDSPASSSPWLCRQVPSFPENCPQNTKESPNRDSPM